MYFGCWALAKSSHMGQGNVSLRTNTAFHVGSVWIVGGAHGKVQLSAGARTEGVFELEGEPR